ncbi:uncharacterized protein LOC122856311 [Aphidius gifuensis]|uniref:uncharacterized protein LOC122856311 n=1 Tax=Aphidius gifuensis TaxID=684658 RepID=UPI001CDC6327|nr:uncharacterized protein LOC122856311 [Aphidius gifuensis]
MKKIIILYILFRTVVSQLSSSVISKPGFGLCPGILEQLYLKTLGIVDIIGKYNDNTTLLFKNIQDEQLKLLLSHTDMGKELIEKMIKTARTKEKKNFTNCLKNGTQIIIDASEKIKYEIEECFDNAVVNYEQSVAIISDMGKNVTNMFKELSIIGKCHNLNIPNVCREWIGPSAKNTVSEFEKNK